MLGDLPPLVSASAAHSGRGGDAQLDTDVSGSALKPKASADTTETLHHTVTNGTQVTNWPPFAPFRLCFVC